MFRSVFIVSNHNNSPINITSHFTDEEIGAKKCSSDMLRVTWPPEGRAGSYIGKYILQVDSEL